MSDERYLLRVLGDVTLDRTRARGAADLSPAKRCMLAALVAAGPNGAPATRLARLAGLASNAPAAVRMSIARLRDHLPDGAIPQSTGGQYRLALAPTDIDAWHLFHWAAGPATRTPDSWAIRHLLSPAEPYANLELTSGLDESALDIVAAQTRLVAWAAANAAHLVGPDFVDVLAEHSRRDPYNERLLELTARRIAETGDRRRALRLLHEGSAALADSGLDPSNSLQALENDLLNGVGPAHGRSVAPKPTMPRLLAEQRAVRYVHAGTALSRVTALLNRPVLRTEPVVIEGPAGVGKTRLLAEIADQATRSGWSLVYAAPSPDGADGSLGCLLAALPETRPAVEDLLRRELDRDSRRLELWATIRGALETKAAGTRSVVLIDDAHWLDSASIDFLRHLITTVPTTPCIVVIAGRSDPESAERWASLRVTARRRLATILELTPMTQDELRALIVALSPSLEPRRLARLVPELHRRGAGLPGVARLLLPMADDAGVLPEPRGLDHDGVADLLIDLPVEVALVGTAAAVLGRPFAIDDVCTVADLDIGAALRHLDQLIRRDLVVEESPTRFRIKHALVDAGFLAIARRSTLVDMHTRALALAGSIHERARHSVGGLPVVPTEAARSAMLDAAEEHLATDLVIEARRAYATAIEIADQPLAVDHLIGYTRALDLTGSSAAATKLRMQAAQQHRADDALVDMITSGLPEAEPIDGSAEVLAMLELVDRSQLSRHGAWQHARHSARQLALVGRMTEAANAARDSAALAGSAPERVLSALTTHGITRRTTPVSESLVVLDDVRDEVAGSDPSIAAEFGVLRALALIEAGRLDEARDEVCGIGRIANLSIIRRWHVELLEALLLDEAGERTASSAARASAFELASRAGIAEANNAYMIGEFADLLARGEAGSLAADVRSGRIDPGHNTLTRAGAARILHEVGDTSEATALAEDVARAMLAAPVSQADSALALAAGALSNSDDTALVNGAKSTLSLRGPSLLVVGAGAACLGPTHIYAAELAVNPSERAGLIEDARAFVESTKTARWDRSVRSMANAHH